MILIVISLILGIGAGVLLRKKERVVKISEKLTGIMVFILLFFLGASLGGNKGIINKLTGIASASLVISIASIIFSIIAVLVVNKVFSGKKDD